MQTILKKLGLAVPTLVLASTTLVTVPVFAQHGSDDSASNGTTTTTTQTETENSGTTTSGGSGSDSGSGSGKLATNRTEAETENNTENETELHSRGAQIVSELEKQHHSGKTAEEKTKACESHKQGLQTKFTHITTNATNLETKISAFLTKAQTYQSTNNVTVDNWDTLVAAANSAKTDTDTAIANLKAVTPTVDCNSTSVASDVATFKAAAQDARDALKVYKTAVKNVFVALQQARDASTSSSSTETEGGNQ